MGSPTRRCVPSAPPQSQSDTQPIDFDDIDHNDYDSDRGGVDYDYALFPQPFNSINRIIQI